jgi:FkbM family methyltransferase
MFKKLFTLIAWILGFNDPHIAGEKSLGKYSYLRQLAKYNLIWIIIDAGAHTGSFTDRVSKHLKIRKAIFIEPNKEHRQVLLEKNYNSVCISKALSVVNQPKYYTRNAKNSGQNYTSNTVKSKEKVNCVTINSIFQSYKIKNNEHYFLKLDIEGNELEILGSIDTKYLDRITAMSIEIQYERNTINVIDQMNKILPSNFEIYRETRYGINKLSRLKPHWTDQLNLFQNLIILNTNRI